ncbi:MAG: hypothetical protein ACK55Z_33500 [bacterium]
MPDTWLDYRATTVRRPSLMYYIRTDTLSAHDLLALQARASSPQQTLLHP